MRRRHGSILLVVLFVMVVLGIIGLSFAYRAGLEARRTRGKFVQAQLRSMCESAIAVAIAQLNEQPSSPFHHPAQSWHSHIPLDQEPWFANLIDERLAGDDRRFRVDYQVTDEEGKLNVLYASGEALEKLGMTPEQIACLFDWMDADGSAQAEGAESQYYLSRQPPHRAKDVPMEMIEELLMIRGFSYRSFWGEDVNRNGLLDAVEDDGADSFPPDNADGNLWPGWISLLTCVGDGKITLNTASPHVLLTLPISEDAVQQVLQFRDFDDFASGALEEHAFRSPEDIEQLQGLSNIDKAVLQSIARFTSTHFRIFANSEDSLTGLRYSVSVLIRLDDQGTHVLQWSAGD